MMFNFFLISREQTFFGNLDYRMVKSINKIMKTIILLIKFIDENKIDHVKEEDLHKFN